MLVNIESPKQRRRQAIRSTLFTGAIELLSAAVLLWLRRTWNHDGFLSWVLLGMAIADLLFLIPLFISLKQRLKEIQGGEEDAARHY